MQLFTRRPRTFRTRLIDQLNRIEERVNDMAATRADLDAAINRMQTAAVALLDAYEAQSAAAPSAPQSEDLQAEVDRLNLIAGQLEQATAASSPATPPPAPTATPDQAGTPAGAPVDTSGAADTGVPTDTGTADGFVPGAEPPPGTVPGA